MKTIQFTSEERTFTNDQGQAINYTARNIIIDGTPYKVSKADGRVFDYQFKEYINGGEYEVSL